MTPQEIFEKAKTAYGKGNYKNYPIDDLAYKIALEAISIAQAEVIFISSNPVLNADAKGYKEKYEKCITVIKRFDADIIGMYDL